MKHKTHDYVVYTSKQPPFNRNTNASD